MAIVITSLKLIFWEKKLKRRAAYLPAAKHLLENTSHISLAHEYNLEIKCIFLCSIIWDFKMAATHRPVFPASPY